VFINCVRSHIFFFFNFSIIRVLCSLSIYSCFLLFCHSSAWFLRWYVSFYFCVFVLTFLFLALSVSNNCRVDSWFKYKCGDGILVSFFLNSLAQSCSIAKFKLYSFLYGNPLYVLLFFKRLLIRIKARGWFKNKCYKLTLQQHATRHA